MIQNIHGFGYCNNTYNNLPRYRKPVNFTGMSLPSQYKTSFDYLAARIVDGNKKWQIDGSLLSAANISKAMEKVFMLNKVFGPYKESNPAKIAWKNYIPQEVRVYCTDKVNEARAGRLRQWQNFLENPVVEGISGDYDELIKDIKSDRSLKFVIWNAINSELQASNRHIPVPFDITALDETVRHFKSIEPKFRAVTCAPSSFLKMYTHRLRDNLLMKKDLSANTEIWVKIPSIKRDPDNKESNIAELEILSNKNWCTRSSLDKAEAALEDGDFYIYLERDDESFWKPSIGMASSKGKIDQIQGAENNNLIPLTELENVKKFIKDSGLKCQSGICDEGPKALQQILIAEKLSQTDLESGKNLFRAIKDKDNEVIYRMLGKQIKTTPDNKYIIPTYKPQVLLNKKSGITVPYSFLGIDEDALLENVSVIDGDLILTNKNNVFDSTISQFPPNLKTVNGRIECSKMQYEKFKNDFLRVVKDPSYINIH